MNLADKQQAVDEITKSFSEATASFLVDFKGCSCSEVTSLRGQLRAGGAKIAVVKNTLAKRAISDTDLKALSEHFSGPTAVIWSGEDPVAPAKIIADFAKENDSFQLKGGSLEGAAVDKAEIIELSKLPSKEQLYAKLLGLLIAPATRLAQTMNAPATQLARLLDIRRQELEKDDK